MQLPVPIRSYFDADQAGDARLALAAFTPDAKVRDEGRTHRGAAEIAGWWRASKDKYRHSARPLQVEATGETTIVKAEVTGNFPGSPAVLRFAFELAGGRIAALEISA